MKIGQTLILFAIGCFVFTNPYFSYTSSLKTFSFKSEYFKFLFWCGNISLWTGLAVSIVGFFLPNHDKHNKNLTKV
jgi:hypothetical protein